MREITEDVAQDLAVHLRTPLKIAYDYLSGYVIPPDFLTCEYIGILLHCDNLREMWPKGLPLSWYNAWEIRRQSAYLKMPLEDIIERTGLSFNTVIDVYCGDELGSLKTRQAIGKVLHVDLTNTQDRAGMRSNLERFMYDEGISAEELSEAVGVSPVSIRVYMGGKRKPSLTVAIKIAAYLDHHVEEIWG